MHLTTYSGVEFDFKKPTAEMIVPEDLIHALARQNRFLGHLSCDSYTVAQHLVLASACVPEEDALSALLHDAQEAYVGDLPRYLKRMKGMSTYKEYEELAWRAVAARFGISRHIPVSVAEADLRLVRTEWRDLHPQGTRMVCLEDRKDVKPYDFHIQPWPVWRAEGEFKHRLFQLWKSH